MAFSTEEEFPLLSGLGLYAAPIRGDGNCLFNALSDQVYGDQSKHLDIRSRVIEYMRQHSDYFKTFISVNPGGGTRRNPKRKNAGAYSSPMTFSSPSPAEIDRQFELHLQSMARGGTWGDNMEISAFSKAYDTNIQIYTREYSYVISPDVSDMDIVNVDRPTAHIAYHTWEHYSSIRNLDGPHSGLPEVRIRRLSPEEEMMQREKLLTSPVVLPWMIQTVEKSLPFISDRSTIRKALEECRGNVDAAVSKLLDTDYSSSSAQGSSSIEREADSDDDSISGPNKRRLRKMSHATHRAMKEREQYRMDLAEKFAKNDGSQESISSALTRSIPRITITQDDEDSMVPSSDNAQATDSSQKIPSRLVLKLPKSGEKVSNQLLSNIKVKSTTSRRRGLSASDKNQMKKRAQKAARKERAQAQAQALASNVSANSSALPILTKPINSSSIVSSGIRTLFI